MVSLKRMKFDIITIFPDIFSSYFGESIISRAQKKELIDIKIHNLRDWTTDKHKTVDDTPYGGGAGMVLKVEPIWKCVETIKSQIQNSKSQINPKSKIINPKQSKVLFTLNLRKKFVQTCIRILGWRNSYFNFDSFNGLFGNYNPGLWEKALKPDFDLDEEFGLYFKNYFGFDTKTR